MDETPERTPSSSVPLTPSPAPWALPARPNAHLPLSTDPAFFGYQFRHKNKKYEIHEMTAHRRGGVAWVWSHGAELRELGKPPMKYPYWLCKPCWDCKTIQIRGTTSTATAIDHMAKIHQMNRDGTFADPKTTPIMESFNTASAANEPKQISTLVTQIAVDKMNLALVTWIVLAHMALSCVENESFRDLVHLLNPGLWDYLYKSGNTIRLLILKDFQQRKERVKTELRASKSMIHISFDLWTASKSMAMLGIVAHYLDRDLVSRSLLLALRQLKGDHSGYNQSLLLVDVIKEFGIVNQIGYFISDNVSSNDWAVSYACTALNIQNPAQRRLRCLGHIINLAAKALLFGKEEGSFDFEISKMAKLRFEVRQALEVLAFWRKKGPIGKLHNIIMWAQRTPQRCETFANMTIDLEGIRNDLFMIRDNVTRWNSTYHAIHRALLLRLRIDALSIQYAHELEDDALTAADWQVLEDLARLLKPFASITKRLEGRAKEGYEGCVWEAIPAIESLIEHLGKMKLEYPQATHPELATSINLAWSKLDDYYKKLDDSPAYAAAMVLHPCYRFTYFETRWKGQLKHYFQPMKKGVRKLYDEHYKGLEVEPSTEQQQEDDPDFLDDFLERHLPNPAISDPWKHFSEGTRTDTAPKNLFQWWAEQHNLPSVRQFAYDHLSIPAMSAETERVFSETKNFIPERSIRLGADIVEAQECEKRWIEAGI